MNSDPLTLAPPRDPDAERAVLGAMLLDGTARATALRDLRSEDFFDPRHQRLFGHLADVLMPSLEEGEAPDLVTLQASLTATEELEAVGGQAYLIDLCDSVPVVCNAPAYIRLVCEKADLRRTMAAGLTAARQAAEGKDKASTVLKAFERETRRCRGSGEASDSGIPILTCLADIEARPLTWLWPGRVSLGKLTLFAGDPALGKSLVTLDLAARVSAGLPWPDAPLEPVEAGDAILLSAEDDPADTIRPRLEAAGADLARVYILTTVRQPDGRPAPFSLERDLPALERAIHEHPGARVIVLDPISAFLGRTDSHVNAEVRAVLHPLADLAARRGVAIVAVTHLSKGMGGRALHRAIGSIAFAAMARAAWHFAADPDDPQRRLMLPAKMNLAPDPTGLAYRLTTAEVSGVGSVARVEWESQPVTMTADDALAAEVADGEGLGALDEAVDFLGDALADGPVRAKDVKERADAAGIAPRTLDRAKKRLQVKAEPDGFRGPWVWRLPGQSAPGSAECASP